MEIVEEQAAKSGLARVTAIKVRIGKLSTIVPEALNFCFGFATEDTLAAGAELVIEEVAAEARCNSCGKTFPVTEAYFLLCPSCSSPDTTLLKGQELDLMSIEGETPDGEKPDDGRTGDVTPKPGDNVQ
ncbi:MAG: hydrogenase maturation nickel metallochaperone HypA [Candidatus Eisenbacteria bacterium]|nr:hydrogenase maturation nickel metallochaperone HypA [Candidatus Eisenbacteria bacterium]